MSERFKNLFDILFLTSIVGILIYIVQVKKW
jgi:hypothetical protein